MIPSAPLHIVVDDMVPFAREAFARLGAVTLLPGRAMTRDTLRDADALIVRSGLKVNAELLENSRVQFVGTTTTGVDHVDQRYLAERNIGFAAAFGCNANSVAEYVLTALLVTARAQNLALHGTTIGIIGVGRIGSRVARKALALGMIPILHDPPLARETGDPRYRPLAEALRADVLTLHVPLTLEGPDPTFHLIGKDELARMTSTAMLINTARGAVVDNHALLEALNRRTIGGAVMDVWEGEPAIHWHLLPRVALGTPHIAGHSFDAKVNGTVMVYQAFCRFLGIEPVWTPPANLLPTTGGAPDASLPFQCDGSGKDFQTLAHDITTTLYDIHGDHARMMGLLALPESMRPEAFSQLRHDYPQRSELATSPISIRHVNEENMQKFNELGIQSSDV